MYQLLFGLGLGFVIAFFFISYYRNIKSIFSDILRFLGFLGKWVRKKSVESKYEIIINGAIDDYNASFEDKILSNCKIQWIDKDSDESYLEEGKAIICLKFDKKNQDLNFFNATYTFTKTALLPVTRNYTNEYSQKAIDLNLTKIIIKEYNRNSLRIFNQKYISEPQYIKDDFEKFEETEKRGLFRTLLIPELHYLGDNLETTIPTKKIEKEIENFFDWFYELASREEGEQTNLNFHSEHIKVGVILVASLDTYQEYGVEAYTKWAEKYASEHYGAIYLLARGNYRASILKEIVSELVNNKGFDQVNKKTTLFEINENGEKIEISLFCLKPNLSKIQYNAWEKIKTYYHNKKQIIGIIGLVHKDEIIVNVNGIEQSIPKEKLSKKELPDLSKYFYPERELLLNIESIDDGKGVVIFNNIETDTDPGIFIESTLKENKEVEVVVDNIQLDREGRERGLKTFCKTINKKVFIPKKYCSYSRFINLKKSFNNGDILKVYLHGFSLEFANFYGEIIGLINPLQEIHNYQENKHYEAIVQEITDNYITTELKPGLECRIFKSEISWDNSKKTTDFNIGVKLEIVLIKIDTRLLRITGSIKRLNKSNNEIFFKQNKLKVLLAKVLKSYEGVGLKFKLIRNDFTGFVYAKELMWGFCSDIEHSFPINSSVNVKPIEFDYNTNEIIYSIRKCYDNDYEIVKGELEIGNIYTGKIIKHFPDIARVEIEYNKKTIQGYVHKSEISNLVYIDGDDINKYLPLEKTFSFILKRKDSRNKIIELSRKKYLEKQKLKMEYGDTIEATIVKVERSRAIFYENEMEGIITENYQGLNQNEKVDVYLINNNGEFGV